LSGADRQNGRPALAPCQ